MEHPKAKGDRTTLAVMLALHEVGVAFAVPFGENTRYDLIIEAGERLARVQCKTGRFRNGCVVFNACISYAHHASAKVTKRDYRGEVDFFAVYCQEVGTVYLIPIEDLNVARVGCLRVENPRNNQRRGVRFAAGYEIGAVALRSSSRPDASAGAG